jgi:hypothetical protein
MSCQIKNLQVRSRKSSLQQQHENYVR